MLEKFLHSMHETFDLDYVTLKIDTTAMQHGAEVAKRLRKSRTNGGIPWMVILDAEGEELISSPPAHL